MSTRTDLLRDQIGIDEVARLVLEHRKIRHGRDCDYGFEERWIHDGRLERGIASIGPAEDRQAFCIGGSGRDQPFG